MKYYLYNSLANNGIRPQVAEGTELVDAVGMDYPAYLQKLAPEDEVVLVGGDGTLNYFINAVRGTEIKNNIYLLGCGTGNDFLKDIGRQPGEEVLINPYLSALPTVYVNGLEKLFINNMGFGIDGYCCEVADQIKEKNPKEEINYSGIAIKGLLFHFKPCHAEITVDGVKHEFDNVWIAPTMKGRFYGGGMMMAPDQDRASGKLSVVVYHCRSKLKALIAFPSIFKGEHVAKKDIIKIFIGNEIKVRFSRPCAAQIDGETVLNVTEYTAVQP
ncbi:MAG: diacylglycerol kinase family protein [Oscillospiraceae bacterium]|nr:diacylglycerol kinase family protein [Oscillospiraceae bacterium]